MQYISVLYYSTHVCSRQWFHFHLLLLVFLALALGPSCGSFFVAIFLTILTLRCRHISTCKGEPNIIEHGVEREIDVFQFRSVNPLLKLGS